MEAPKLLLLILLIPCDLFIGKSLGDGVTPQEAKQLRDEVREMFYHAFNGYMDHAFPRDELRPLSCGGEDTLGGYALTLIDSLDTLALLGDRERFTASVEWIGKNLRFDINKTVSIFETTIRILGGLISAHLIASDHNTGMWIPSYDDELLHLAEDLARRMLPAFDTPTGIPFGSVNLLHGVDENESKAYPLCIILFSLLCCIRLLFYSGIMSIVAVVDMEQTFRIQACFRLAYQEKESVTVLVLLLHEHTVDLIFCSMHTFNSQSLKMETPLQHRAALFLPKKQKRKNRSKEENTRDPLEMILFDLI